jgi:hypothetical protein
MRNSTLDRIIDGPLGPPLVWLMMPLIWLIMAAFALLAALAWPILRLWQMRQWLREWREAIRAVDAGGDSNESK